MEMTARERWMAIFNRQPVDRVPTDYWGTPEVTQRLLKDLGCADEAALWRKLHIDRPVGVGARLKHKVHPEDPLADIWGVRKTNIAYGTGTYAETAYHPLAQVETVQEVEAYRWPDAERDFDYSGVGGQIAKLDGKRPVQGGGYEPFLLYCAMRGMEQAYEDLLVNPELAEAIFGHLFAFHFAHNQKLLEAGQGKIDIFYLAEDLGSQAGPLVGLETYRQFFRENQKKMADLAKRYGAHVIYHTDGAASIFLPDLVDYVGIEILNPIQWRCPGMERETLVAKYGQKIGFNSSIDNQQTLPYGTVADVVAEVRDAVRIFRDARWICGPCHNLQPVTPTANIVALYETIWEIGKK